MATHDARHEADAARARLYERLFGPCAEVVRDPMDVPLAVDVRIHRPGHAGRAFYTLVTSGMSDLPMALPEGEEGARRAEMALYVDQPGPATVKLLRTLARMPHERGMWLGHGHTIPNGMPAAPLFPGSALTTVLVLETVVAPEREMRELLSVDGEPVVMLWPALITDAECRVKVEQGVEALLAVFDRERVSFVLDVGRKSVV